MAQSNPKFLSGKPSGVRMVFALLSVLVSITAAPEEPSPAVDLKVIEDNLDHLVEQWPTSEQDFDSVMTALDASLGAFRSGYATALRMHHAPDEMSPRAETTPQALAKRRGKIISFFGESGTSNPGNEPRSAVWPGTMPRLAGYYGIQCLTPIYGKPATWYDALLLDEERHRVHATRFDEHNLLRELVLIVWSGHAWRILELSMYPDGQPSRLRFWQDGKPSAFLAEWKPDRSLRIAPVIDGRYVGDTPVAVCAVSVSYRPPGSTSDIAVRTPFPMPVAAVHIVPTGTTARIDAPLIAEYAFMGWSGDRTGKSQSLDISAEGPVRLVAHYAWLSESDGKRRWFEPSLEDAIRRQIGKPNGPVSSFDLLAITSLDLTGARLDEILQLRHLKSLRELNLSGNPMRNLFALSAPAAIEAILEVESARSHPDLLSRVLLALNAGIAPPVDTLVLQDTELSRANGLEYLSSLKHLNLRNAGQRDLGFVKALQNLETLDISQNAIENVTPLTLAGPRLKSINAEDNQIANLGPLATRKAWPDGMTLELRGNSLSPESLCTTIPALEASGFLISFDGACADLGLRISEEDGDGDGYTNREEWAFVSLFSALEAEREVCFAAAIADTRIPRAYMAAMAGMALDPNTAKVPIETIATTPVGITINGKGTVYPGVGNHNFAARIFKDDGTWEWNKIILRPEAAPGWEVVPLREENFPDDYLVREEDGQGMVISMEVGGGVTFEFREVEPDLFIDLVDALKTFVETYYPREDPYSFDRNGLSHHGDKTYQPKPNGMPDAAEFALLQALLQPNPGPEHSKKAYAYNEAKTIWRANLAVSRRVLGKVGRMEPCLIHVLAAYATVGNWTDCGAATHMIHEAKGLMIEPDLFEQGLYEVIRPEESLFTRATLNETIWQQVAEGRTVDRNIVDAYAAAVVSQPEP